MNKRKINIFEEAPWILECLPKGILLTTKANGKANTMTIGWGAIGIEWGLPIFTAYVRESRYTHQMLENNPAFTINVPLKGMDVRKIVGFCGTQSGRDVDKFAAMDLHAVDGSEIDVPGIAELPLTIECKVILSEDQNDQDLPDVIRKRYYPQGDYHTIYYGLIADAYIIEK